LDIEDRRDRETATAMEETYLQACSQRVILFMCATDGLNWMTMVLLGFVCLSLSILDVRIAAATRIAQSCQSSRAPRLQQNPPSDGSTIGHKDPNSTPYRTYKYFSRSNCPQYRHAPGHVFVRYARDFAIWSDEHTPRWCFTFLIIRQRHHG